MIHFYHDNRNIDYRDNTSVRHRVEHTVEFPRLGVLKNEKILAMTYFNRNIQHLENTPVFISNFDDFLDSKSAVS